MSQDFTGVDEGIGCFEPENNGFSSTLNGKDVHGVEPLDAKKLYKAARDFTNPDVQLYMEKLDDLVMQFFDKCKVPMVRPGPILFMEGRILVMKGLLFSPKMTEAFNMIGPAVKLIVPNGQFLTEVHVDIAFFEMVLSGESGGIRRVVSDGVKGVIEV